MSSKGCEVIVFIVALMVAFAAAHVGLHDIGHGGNDQDVHEYFHGAVQSAGGKTGVGNAAACAMVSLAMVMTSSMAMSKWVSIVDYAAAFVATCGSQNGDASVPRRRRDPTTTNICCRNGGVCGVQS